MDQMVKYVRSSKPLPTGSAARRAVVLGALASVNVMCPALAESGEADRVRLDEDYGDAFVHYLNHLSPAKPKEKAKPDGLAPSPAPAPELERAQPQSPAVTVKAEGKQAVDVAWLRKNYPVLEERAINDPTDGNVSAYLYAKRIIVDKSSRFSEAVYKVTNQDPLLNENNRIPYASAGAQAVANADNRAQEKAVRELAQVGGLVVFIDSSCRFCAMELGTLTALKKSLGLEFIVVSIDGRAPKDYRGNVLPDNGLFRKLDLKLTPSVVFVSKPTAYIGADPNQYLIVSQGYYAQDEMTKQIAYAGHSTHLLSKEVMRDLDVWHYGVASTDDLSHLKLDVDHPEEFKQTLGPILLKQYK